uniref:Ectonucleoside triphosphate diphosphohydrolase 7 n=1 Tax=Tetraodon nigroviridis TaxID=99883 RepID=H3C908_TETNG
EEAAKGVLAEFNLGCQAHTQHVYRVYVTTFLGYGGNMARRRYEERLLNATLASGGTGLSPDTPYPDPCLPAGLRDAVARGNRTLHLRGQGDWSRCLQAVRPSWASTTAACRWAELPGAHQLRRHEFYGFSEFFYCSEDVLRLGARYHSRTFAKAAADYCATQWATLEQRLENKLFSQHADLDRVRKQCFNSAWMFAVLHGFRFPRDYAGLTTAQLVYDREVQWTLGAILFKTRFLPLRDLQQEALRQSHPRLVRSSFVHHHHLLSLCILVVLLAILLHVLR